VQLVHRGAAGQRFAAPWFRLFLNPAGGSDINPRMLSLRTARRFCCAVILLLGCRECPECPPCECSGLAADAAAGDAGGLDAGLEESDAGVDAAPIGGKPRPVTSYDLHGRAGFERVSIWSAPHMESPRLGYFRKGTRVRLGDPRYSTEGCPEGWYELKEGGYVCQGRGMLVGTKPRYVHRPPPPPRVDELDPYRHGFVRGDWTPAYKRIPTEDELWKPPEREIDAGLSVEGKRDAGGDAGIDGGEPPTEVVPHDPEGADGGVDYYRYTERKHRVVSQLLIRGFWISVANRVFDDELRRFYYETVDGDYVPGNEVHLVRPPDYRGYEVLGSSPLPAAIVSSRHAAFYTERRNRFRGIGPVDRLAVYRVLGESEGPGIPFYRIEGDRWLKSTNVVYFELREPPEGVGEREKWILIDLSRQSLEAYQGVTPVYATLISSGLPGDPETETPTGRFNVSFKHLTDDMAGTVGDDEVYSVEDVPWVQYVHRNVALHSSFWHSHYGRPRSHGCINLSPADARFLFEWTAPRLPSGWHGVAASDERPGTLVIIEGEAPE
jgi:hypothetical protein